MHIQKFHVLNSRDELIFNPADIAETLSNLPADERLLAFLKVPKEYKAEVFSHLDPDFQEDTIRSIGSDEVSEILNAMTPDDRTALLRTSRMNLSNTQSIILIHRKEELH